MASKNVLADRGPEEEPERQLVARKRRDAVEVEDAGSSAAPHGRGHLRSADRHDDDDLQEQEQRESAAVRKRAELKSSPGDAQAERLHDHDRAEQAAAAAAATAGA